MKLVVTGGSGFLGAHVVERLLAAGHEVRLVGRTQPPARLSGAEFVQADLRDPSAAGKALAGREGLYHLAGQVSFDPADGRAMYALHVDATRELLKAARDAGICRIVLASTSGTIAVSDKERIGTEEDDYPITVVARWPYYLSKIYEEKLALEFCRKHQLPLVVLNPSLLFGPGDERLSSTWAVAKFLNRDLPSVPRGGMSFVDVRDAADVFVRALSGGEVYGRHLMGLNLSVADFFGRLERLTGVPSPRLRLPSRLNVLGARLLEKVDRARGLEPRLDEATANIAEHFFYLDASKAERELGFRARDPHETLFDTVQDLMSRMPPEALPGVRGRLRDLRR